MRKIWTVFMVAFLLISSTLGCSSNSKEGQASNGNDSTKNNSTQSEPAGTVTLELWHYWSGLALEVMEGYINEFNNSQTEVKINPTFFPYADYTKKLLISATAGSLPDMLVYGNNETAVYVEAGLLEDITAEVEQWGQADNLFEGVRDSHIVDNAYYGLPLYANCLVLFYNKELVKTPPVTWDELINISKSVTTKDRYGLAVTATPSETGTFQWLPFLWSTGEDLATIDSPNAVRALALWKDMIKDGLMSQEVTNWTQQDTRIAFQTGRVAMMINGPWNIPALQDEAPDLQWGVAEIPKDKQSASILGGESFGVGKGKNKEAAFKFIQWINEPQRYAKIAQELGGLPPQMDLANDPYYQNDPIWKTFMDQLVSAKPRAYGAKYNEMSKAIQDAIANTLSGGMDPEKSLKGAAEIIKPKLLQ